MYPYINQEYTLHYCEDHAVLFGDVTSHFLSNIELYLIEKINGTKSVNDIVNEILDNFNYTDYTSIENVVNKFINKFAKYISFNNAKTEVRLKTTGVKNTITPLTLSIELTNRCNLKCKHCLKDAGYNKSTDLNYNNILKTLEFLKKHTKTVQLSGGEAMLYKNFLPLLDYCKQNFNNVSVSTTATLINSENVKHFNNTKTFVSIYSSIESEHDNITLINDSFKKSLNGIKLLVENNVNVSISSIATSFNIDRLEDLINLAIKYQAKNIRFGQFVPMGRGLLLGDKWILNNEEKLKLNQLTTKFNKIYKDVIDVTIFPLETPKKNLAKNKLCCGAGKNVWIIRENGNIVPCYFLPESIFSLGNINDDDIEQLVKKVSLDSMGSKLLIWNNNLLKEGYDISYFCDELKNYLPV